MINVKEVNTVKIVSIYKGKIFGISEYTRISQDTFRLLEEVTHPKYGYKEKTKEIDLSESKIKHRIDYALQAPMGPYCEDRLFEFRHELYINGNQIFNEEKEKSESYGRELYFKLMRKYSSNVAKRLFHSIYGLAIKEKLFSDEEITDCLRVGGVKKLRNIGKVYFEYVKDYFQL